MVLGMKGGHAAPAQQQGASLCGNMQHLLGSKCPFAGTRSQCQLQHEQKYCSSQVGCAAMHPAGSRHCLVSLMGVGCATCRRLRSRISIRQPDSAGGRSTCSSKAVNLHSSSLGAGSFFLASAMHSRALQT